MKNSTWRLDQPHAFKTVTTVFVAFLLAGVLVRMSIAQPGTPLKEQEIMELLQAGVASSRVSAIVDERGIDFTLTPDVEQRIRGAGGDDDLVSALRRASARRADADRPRTGGLIIKSTPGEAQIYLNDEPKGMTSIEGEIRLPTLPAGDYTLRVSLPGYQSFEKPVSVTAGGEQTVYVTLVQKSAVQPVKDNNLPAPPSETAGIPIPGLQNTNVQFYEGPFDPFTEKSKRVYRYSFDRFTARTIFWEVDLNYPALDRRIEFPLQAVWYRADGTEMARQTLNAHADATWKHSWHTLGYGFKEPGHWRPGTYRVDFFYNNGKVATGTFQIN